MWLEIGSRRDSTGVRLHIRAVPEVEEFVRGLGNGKTDGVEIYGRNWLPVNSKPLNIYKIDKQLLSDTYTLAAPAETFRAPSCGRVNLSFLRIAGISDPQGIQFRMTGPYSKSFIREAQADIGREFRVLAREYIVPVHINLRISSHEV